MASTKWQTNSESTDSGLRVTCELRANECLVSLSGKITVDDSPGLRVQLIELLQPVSFQILTVDLGEVSYVDTSGLAILLEVLKAARSKGVAFRLSRLTERPRYLLEATRLLHLFEEVENQND
jgi:anti-sigma B factor antagonist